MSRKQAVHGWDLAAQMSGNPRMDNAIWEYRKLTSDDARAGFVDKWARLAARDMNSAWSMFYDSLRIIKERKLYENPAVMEDKKARASFEEYWADVAQKPFQTWAELESTYHHVKEHCPDLLDTIDYGKARTIVAAETKKGPPEGNQNAVKGEKKQLSKLDICFQANRARENGVGRQTQIKLDKLASKRPDLLERVRAGELTAHGASVAAGFSKPPILVPADPLKASRRLLKHFNGDALTTLVAELANHAGFDLIPRR